MFLQASINSTYVQPQEIEKTDSKESVIIVTFKNLVQRSDTLTAISPEPRILVDVSVLRKKDAFVFRGMKDFERYISEKNPFEKG